MLSKINEFYGPEQEEFWEREAGCVFLFCGEHDVSGTVFVAVSLSTVQNSMWTTAPVLLNVQNVRFQIDVVLGISIGFVKIVMKIKY